MGMIIKAQLSNTLLKIKQNNINEEMQCKLKEILSGDVILGKEGFFHDNKPTFFESEELKNNMNDKDLYERDLFKKYKTGEDE